MAIFGKSSRRSRKSLSTSSSPTPLTASTPQAPASDLGPFTITITPTLLRTLGNSLYPSLLKASGLPSPEQIYCSLRISSTGNGSKPQVLIWAGLPSEDPSSGSNPTPKDWRLGDLKDPRITTELIFFATKGSRGMCASPTNVFRFNRVLKGERVHGAEKPVDLLKKLIDCTTLPGDFVLDSCCGSGSTFVACHGLRRRALGIESDADYFRGALSAIHSNQVTEPQNA